MTNPVGTKEQREELRQFWILTDKEHGLKSENDLLTALDGLDIAQEVAEAVAKLGNFSSVTYEKAVYTVTARELQALMETRRKWDKWKGEGS